MCFVVMMVNCAVIFISTSEVSGVGGRRVLILSVVWLSKIWISMRFVRVVFAAVCGDCPVFSTPTNPRVTLQTKLGWSGARAVMVVVLLCFTVIFRVHLSPRASKNFLGLAGMLELAMRS